MKDIRETAFKEKLVPAFINSTLAAFETMAFLPTEADESQMTLNDQPRGNVSGTIGISGNIALTGDELCGNLSLIFPDGIADDIFRSMMMMEPGDEVEPQEVVDAVGELSNMAAGGAKAAMQDIGLHFMISLPSVVTGKDHTLAKPASGSMNCVVPMKNEKGTFYLDISFSWR